MLEWGGLLHRIKTCRRLKVPVALTPAGKLRIPLTGELLVPFTVYNVTSSLQQGFL